MRILSLASSHGVERTWMKSLVSVSRNTPETDHLNELLIDHSCVCSLVVEFYMVDFGQALECSQLAAGVLA